ncbi:hypothetical protein [Nostoc sp. CMAA1605]|uniref:hypothetical protein n=1 Tax=Nostoc sp. CMAA1605 TaxID=2055159 RepID=UPI001F18EDC0|nr:hypothetical protein [Nostoc sp. CMAA1605]
MGIGDWGLGTGDWGQGRQGGQGGQGRFYSNVLCPIPHARFPMPDAQCPMPYALCPMPNAPYPNSILLTASNIMNHCRL